MENFRHLMRLIDEDVFANIKGNESLREKTNPFMIRRLKENMKNFDGTPLFPNLFYEMDVSDDAIRFLLGHSKYELGALQHYILSDAKYIKEIRAAQVIIETFFETAMELESNYNITLDLEEIYEELPNVFTNQKKDKNYIHLFKEHLVKYAFCKLEQKILNQSGDRRSDYFTFKAPELYNQMTMPPQGYIPHTPTPYQSIHGMNPMSYDHANTAPFYPLTYFYMGK